MTFLSFLTGKEQRDQTYKKMMVLNESRGRVGASICLTSDGHNGLVAGLSSASPTRQSCAKMLSWRRLNSL
jgi:hypothetical protein